MATLYSIATGNWTDAATWGLVDSTSLLNSETGSEVLTTAYSGTRSSAFTPGAITVSHIAVKLSVRTGTTGTISVSLRNATIGLDDFVTGTEVTINCADLVAAVTADLNGGWVFFKLATPVLLLAATNYNVQAKTSSATQVSLFRDGTTDNIARLLVTTTTQAPVAGDDMVVAGEKTGAGTANAFTVTMNETATTDYGAASTSLVTPSLAICDGGTLTWGTTAATNYLLKISGNVIVYAGGTYNQGTSGTPLPSGSTSELRFDCGTNVDFGLTIRNLGTMNAYGTKAITAAYTKISADEAAGQTVISLVDTTGFEVGDELVFASTTRTASECESKFISTVDSGVQVTLTAGLTNAHSGTNDANGDIRGEVATLTRNVKIFGTSATLQTYIDIKATAVVNWSKIELKWMGSGTTNKRGVTVNTTTGTFIATLCSFHDFVASFTIGLFYPIVGANGFTLDKCVMYNIAQDFVAISTAGSGVWNITSGVFIRTVSSSGFSLNDVGGVLTNNVVAGAATEGIALNEASGQTNLCSGNVCHSNSSSGLGILSSVTGVISDSIGYRNGTYGCQVVNTGSGPSQLLLIDTITCFGNAIAGFAIDDSLTVEILDYTCNAGVTLTQPVGLVVNRSICSVTNLIAGSVTSHATSDVRITLAGYVRLFNPTLGSTNKFSSSGFVGGFIVALKYGGVAGDNRAWYPHGRTTGTQPQATAETDTTIYSTASPSLRLYPGSATLKLRSQSFFAAVASGNTLTPSIKVRESVVGDGTDYNGNRIRLIVLANPAIGINADTVLDTATGTSEGAFEELTGTTAAVTGDGVLEFVVDCDGTTGWINVDDFSCVGEAVGGAKYWSPLLGGPGMWGSPAAGGRSGIVML